MMADTLILYNYFRSSASYRVRIALDLKKIPYKYEPVHLLKDGGEQNKSEFRKLNAMGQLPCIVHNGKVLAQSMAILEYIDALWPEPRLFPKDPYTAGLVRQCCENINSGIHPLQNLKVQKQLETRFGATADQKTDWAAYWIQDGFQALEKFLSQTAGLFSVGDQITAADLYVVPQVLNARRYKVDIKAFPIISRIETECMKNPSFLKGHPDHQPDTPKE